MTVHSLGAVAARGGRAELVAADGRVLGSTIVPDIAAPTDLAPKIVPVELRIPVGSDRAGLAVRVALPGDAPETTRLNNVAPLPR
ncbi:hypothetical protein [Sphingomonas aliaeris]|uniref:hypothetical protein n=1 Tax=Sphingomonas aliaeris TaxID=2759526 RepID=UPI00298F2695|nr:hypothetical protein [Sphingomonas aliaeris]